MAIVDSFTIVVLGAGPAGCVAALGLAGLGHDVAVVGRRRAHTSWEGLSERTVEALRAANCSRAVSVLEPEVRRCATWNGQTTAANRESVVERARFDTAFWDDLTRAGVPTYKARVARYAPTDGGWMVCLQGQTGSPLRIGAQYLLEARGREAPLKGAHRESGPATTALAQTWALPDASPPVAAVAAFEDGWAWFAGGSAGFGSLQLMVSSEDESLPGRKSLADFYQQKVAGVVDIQRWIKDAIPQGKIVARTAAVTMVAPFSRERFLRVGDAAVAIDPLSGQGIFEAVGSARAAVPVVNTILRVPGQGKLALDYYREREEEIFLRYSRIGRDFYREERRWPAAPFWRTRQGWPDDHPAHRPFDGEPPRIAERPVVADGVVVMSKVIVTPDHPRGVWQVAGVPLVPLLGLLGSRAVTTASAAAALERGTPAVETAWRWLNFRGLTDSTPRY